MKTPNEIATDYDELIKRADRLVAKLASWPRIEVDEDDEDAFEGHDGILRSGK